MTDAREVIADSLNVMVVPYPGERVARAHLVKDAILQALEQAGYVVVPKEPTEAIKESVWTYLANDSDRSEVWQTMLAAANPPSPSHRGKAPR